MMATPWYGTAVPNQQQRDRYRAQVTKIIQRFNGRVAAYPVTPDLADTEFLHSTEQVLARDDATLPAVVSALGMPLNSVARPIAGLARIPLPLGTTAPQAVHTVEIATGSRLAAFDRLVHLTAASACPATEPEKTTSPGPVPSPAGAKHPPMRDVHVAVIDTGLPPDGTTGTVSPGLWSWMANVSGAREDSRHAGHYKGHGLFVAGVLALWAPSASIKVHAFIFTSGGQIESDLVQLIVQALGATPRPDIISMSAGTSLAGAPAGAAADSLMSFDVLYREHLRDTNTLLVCAAGNDAGPGPFEPASLNWPVAVGALDASGTTRAGYSNYGPWVDVYARGSDIVNAYPNGLISYEEPPDAGNTPDFAVNNKLVEWSGTSFSTPIVAALIAERMATHNEAAPVAWAALKARADANAAVNGGLPVLP